MTSLALVAHPLSSCCWKVEIALREKGLEYSYRQAELGDPAFRGEFAALWPTAKIPLLLADGRPIPETSIQIEYLEQVRPDPPLLPADGEQRLKARLWDRLFDQYVMTPMQAYVAQHFPGMSPDADVLARHAATLEMAWDMIETRLEAAPFACGAAFSLADCAAAPALFYARCCHPFGARPALQGYFDSLMQRPSVLASVKAAKPFFAHFPLGERLDLAGVL